MQIIFFFVEHLIYKYYELINGNKIICAKDIKISLGGFIIYIRSTEINHIL